MIITRYGRKPRKKTEISIEHALADGERQDLFLSLPAHYPELILAGHTVIDEVIDRKGQTVPRLSLGGPLSYSSLALSGLGYPLQAITKIGEDLPEEYSTLLKEKARLDITNFVAKGKKTTRFLINRSSEPRRLWLLSKCANLSLADFSKYPRSGKALIVNSVAGEVSLSILSRVSREFDHVFVDSQGFVRRFDRRNIGAVSLRSGLDISSLSGVDFLKADRFEFAAWTGSPDFQNSIRQISKFVKYLLITSGPRNVEVYEGTRLRWRAKPIEVKTLDTTGAGDIFLAMFAAAFCETGKIEGALQQGISAASLAVQVPGIEKAILDPVKVRKAAHMVEVLEN